MDKVYKRVALWNSRRYDREYNAELARALIKEELQEYTDAKTEVDRLDALCDVTYIALGMHWKSNLSMKSLQETEEDALDTAQHINMDAANSGQCIIALVLNELPEISFENEGLIVAYTANILL